MTSHRWPVTAMVTSGRFPSCPPTTGGDAWQTRRGVGMDPRTARKIVDRDLGGIAHAKVFGTFFPGGCPGWVNVAHSPNHARCGCCEGMTRHPQWCRR